MEYKGLSILGIWLGTAGLSDIFLSYNFTTDFVIVMVMIAVGLTVYILRLKPDEDISDKMDNIAQELSDLGDRLSTLEKNVDEINKLLED